MKDISLTNRVIIVTGASRGLGLTMARAFIERGAFVVATSSRNSPALLAIEAEFGDQAICISSDVTNPENWDHVTRSVAIMRGDNQGYIDLDYLLSL